MVKHIVMALLIVALSLGTVSTGSVVGTTMAMATEDDRDPKDDGGGDE
jgi:hypothetical protein